MRRQKFGILGSVLLLAVAPAVFGQGSGAGTGGLTWQRVASFLDARDLSVSPAGDVFVVDAAQASVYRLLAGGAVEAFPSPGTLPTAVDATSGLSVMVADGAGTIDRVSSAGGLIIRIRVPATSQDRFRSDPGFRPDPPAIDAAPGGIPGPVAQLRSGGVVAFESVRGMVLYWDRAGRPERALEAVHGEPLDVVDLAVLGDHVILADATRSGLVLLDEYGTYHKSIGQDLGPVRAVVAMDQTIWAATADFLFAMDGDGEIKGVWPVGLPEEAVALAFEGSDLLLLTSTSLYRCPLPLR